MIKKAVLPFLAKAAFWVCLAAFVAPAQAQTGYEIGEAVADFALKDVSGKTIGLSDYKNDKGVAVIFTCNHCPFSKMYQDRIIALHKEFAAKGVPVLAINPNDAVKSPNDSFEEMVKRAKEKEYPFRYVYDDTQATAKAFDAKRTPQVYLLQKKGAQFHLVYTGALDDNPDESQITRKFLAESIQLLLQGNPIIDTDTKAVGCTIKWKDAD